MRFHFHPTKGEELTDYSFLILNHFTIYFQFYFAHQLEHQRVGPIITETDMNVLYGNLNSHIMNQFVFNDKENKANPYKCLICYSQCSSVYEIRGHVRERHVYKSLPPPIKPNMKKEITCNECGMVIKRHNFRKHLMTHSDVKLYSCSTCGKKFRNKAEKIVHERLHTGEVSFYIDFVSLLQKMQI